MLNRAFRCTRLDFAPHRSGADVSAEVEWDHVTQRNPCPVCGSGSGCHRHAIAAFVSCSRCPSEWPLTNGAWLHRVDAVRADHGP